MNWSRAAKYSLVFAALAGGAYAYRGAIAREAERTAAAAPAKPLGPRPVLAEGRMVTYPGKQVLVGTELGGPLRRLTVAEKSFVKKGDVIAEIAVDEQRAALREAHARAKEATVDVDFSGTELDRTRALHDTNALPKAALDRAEHDRNAATARRDSANASANRLETLVAKATIRAPIDGVVLAKHAELGEIVPPGAPLVSVADVSALRVEAEIDEFDGARVSLGQSVRVWAEGYPGNFRGEIEEIPDEVVSRRIKPQDPGRPTDTRVLLVKVKLLDGPSPLRLGQRVELEIAPKSSSQLTQAPAK